MTTINSTKPKINEKFIINVQGTNFVKYEGLLDFAHQKGLKSIKTEIIQLPNPENNNTCIVKAICKTDDGEFHGIGDASPNSVNRMIIPHLIRMAETRSKARALRDLTNVGMTAVEELGEDVVINNKNSYMRQAPSKSVADKAVNSTNNGLGYSCSACSKDISQAENNYSQKRFGRSLCMSCQDIVKNRKK